MIAPGSRFRTALCLAGALLLAVAAAAEDWPHWRGPRYDGISRETGLLKSWPADGPKVLWKKELTGGYSSLVAAGGRIYTQARDGNEEVVLCLDAGTGAPVWDHRYPVDYDRHPTLDQRFKSGPRSTPAVAGGMVYTIGTTGVVCCLDAATGKPAWRRDLMELGGRACPEFGYCNSPLVVGDLVYVQPGGPKGTSIAALDRRTGEVAWKALDDPIGYSTPILLDFQGAPHLVFFTGTGLVAVTPREGKPLWRYPWKTAFDLNVATPIHRDGQVFLSSNYGKGCALVRLKPGADPETVYQSGSMQNHTSTSVLYEGHLYGFSADRLRCVDWATGNVVWDQRGLGRGNLLIADGHLIALGEGGDLVLAEASPKAYVEKARWKALGGPCWNVPVLSGGKLFLRNEKTLLALELAVR